MNRTSLGQGGMPAYRGASEHLDLTSSARCLRMIRIAHALLILMGFEGAIVNAFDAVVELILGFELAPWTLFQAMLLGVLGYYSLIRFPGLVTRKRWTFDLAVFAIALIVTFALVSALFHTSDRLEFAMRIGILSGSPNVAALEAANQRITQAAVLYSFLLAGLALGVAGLVLLRFCDIGPGTGGGPGGGLGGPLDIAAAAEQWASAQPRPGHPRPLDARTAWKYVRYGLGAFAVDLLLGLIPNDLLRNFASLLSIPVGLVAFLCLIRARQYFQPSYDALIEVDHRAPILFLRSFVDDVTPSAAYAVGPAGIARLLDFSTESRLAGHFSKFGPFIAVGSPKDKLPLLGAPRIRLSDDDWQVFVENMIVASQSIVMMVGMTPAIDWELQTTMRHGAVNKLLLLFPRSLLWNRQAWKRDRKLTAERFTRLKASLQSTPWAAALETVTEPDRVFALALREDGAITVVLSRVTSNDVYQLAAEIVHARLGARAAPA
jgi:hypothetical protein